MPISLQLSVQPNDPKILCDFLSEKSGLPKSKVKDALTKGALWLKKRNKKNRRVRRAKTVIYENDIIRFHYNEDILKLDVPQPLLVKDYGNFSLWDKPAGMLSQGTKYGDHCSILRKVSQHYKSKREVFLIHRLDREASGIFLIAHNKKAASKLSELFKNRKVEKHYLVGVKGDLGAIGEDRQINNPLDGKEALTIYNQISYVEVDDYSLANVQISTGRFHQIRRHFVDIGHPVLGDPLYGSGNKNKTTMMLRAIKLEFISPFTKKTVSHELKGFF